MRALARSSRALARRLPSLSAASLGQHLQTPLLLSQRLLSTRKQPKKEEEELTLAEAISAEIQEELSNDEVDQEYVDCREGVLKRFQLSEELGSSVTRLSRTHGKEQIEVVFNCLDEEEGFGGGDLEDGEAEEAEADFVINFEVKVSKEGLGAAVFRCTASGSGRMEVLHLQYVPAGKNESDVDLYGGPKFDQLNDTVQRAATEYLVERGIDDDLCYFVLSHSAHKEQKEYENWLAK